MAGETIGQAEFKEIPEKFYTVIADDESYYADSTERAIVTGFSSGNKTHGEIHKASGVMDLLGSALFGNDGRQADIVLLDDQYTEKLDNWKPTDEHLQLLASQAGFDFTPFLNNPKLLELGLLFPNSIHFAMLLRIFGYKNNIFVVSGNPPTVEAIEGDVMALAKYVPEHYKPTFPINGFSIKAPYQGEITYANSISAGIWNRIKIRGGLPQTLQKLFFNQSVK